ncbi:MAG: hypothetical protein RMI01_10390 [Thermodesulfovibrio sp.]|nr:hypothetical protein [Thermodesulfovibrio sp.]
MNNLQKAVFKFLPQNAPETVLQSVVRSINLIARTIGYLKNVAVIGEWNEPETHLIPLVLGAALGRREDVKIFGTDYDTPDGICIRD